MGIIKQSAVALTQFRIGFEYAFIVYLWTNLVL